MLFMFVAQTHAQIGTLCEVTDANSYSAGQASIISSFSTSGGDQNISNTTAADPSSSAENDFTVGITFLQFVSGQPGATISYELSQRAGYAYPMSVYIFLDSQLNNFSASTTDPSSYTTLTHDTSAGSNTISGSFTIPADLSPGDYRMRVFMDYNNSGFADYGSYGPCGHGGLTSIGEVEDYTLRV